MQIYNIGEKCKGFHKTFISVFYRRALKNQTVHNFDTISSDFANKKHSFI